jgi:outer membrane receptor protein involved in Fe transport
MISMANNDVLRRAVRYALFANAAAAAAIPAAQAADTAPDEAPVSEVIVTGSRISAPGLTSVSPVTSVGVEEIKQQGSTRIEDLLNTLPQVTPDMNSGVSNGATGEATVNLRDLGVQRTLVLINGRRLMPGDPNGPAQNGFSAPDLNNIPAALVERIDVLTGGASSTYGADAVAGVVNFVMNDHFEGVQVNANASMYNHHNHSSLQSVLAAAHQPYPTDTSNDGKSKDITVLLGQNFADGKGNFTAYGTYRRVDALLEGKRDFSSCVFGASGPGGSLYSCGGSSTSATGRFLGPNGSSTVDPVLGLVPYVGSKYAYNFAPTNYFQRPDERWMAGEFAHLDVSDHVTVYNEFMFMQDRSTAQIAPGGAFFGSGNAVDPVSGIPNGKTDFHCNNPLWTPAEVAAFCNGSTLGTTQLTVGRRNVEGGPRFTELTHIAFRMVVGARGEISDGWKYDAYLMEGQTQYENFGGGNFSKAALTNAFDAVPGPGGTAVCASGVKGCVPYNPWVPGGVTPAQLAYLQIPTVLTGFTEERVGDANVTGDLGKYGVKFPWNQDGLIVNVGTQWRSEHATLHPDAPDIQNDVAGNGNPILPVNAGFSLWEGYFEAGLPILEDKPLAKELSFETGYRYSSYNLGFNTNTYKFGVNWAPTSDVRVRTSYQRAVRAPNIQELFQQQVVALDGSANGDPCATSSGSPPAATAPQCARTGVTGAQYGKVVGNSAGQYNGLTGGNAKLKPETADTVSAGFVLTPSMLPNFTMSLDYFHIKVKNVITSTGFAYQMNQCITNNLYCNSIHRDPSGSLWLSPSGYIDDITLNLGGLTTQGADLAASYKLDLDTLGKLDFTFTGTYTAQLITEVTQGGPSYNCAGYFGNTCGVPVPKLKTKTRITYETPVAGLGVSLQWRRIAAVQNDQLSPNQLLQGTPPALFRRIGQFNYLDLSASYAVNKTVSMLVGINNVLDKDPPILSGTAFPTAFVNGNTYVGTYDTLGRYIFANVTLNF